MKRTVLRCCLSGSHCSKLPDVEEISFSARGFRQGTELSRGMRKQELPEDVIAILKTRIALSRDGVFPMRHIWEGWRMSKSTLLRYDKTKYRELSREIARKNNSLRHGLGGKCAKCDESLKGHARCSFCTILIHVDALPCRCGFTHGAAYDENHCTDCIDTYAPHTISPYQEYVETFLGT